jgi:FkbM family methyltransferase
MKKFILSIIRNFGYTVIKYHPSPIGKSVRSNSLTLHKTPTGNYYLPTDAKGDVIANSIINGVIFEHEVVELAKKYVKKNTTVLDLGANFGQMSVLFSNMVGEEGKVYSFEADDFIFEILSKNIEANGKSIIAIKGAVHNVEGEILNFPVQDFKEFDTYGSYGIDYSNTIKGREVKTVTVDSLNIQTPISFMKIDVQGGDLQAMQGAVQTIKRNRMPILFEYEYHFEERYNLKFQDYVDFVLDIDYRFEKVLNGHNFLIIPR